MKIFIAERSEVVRDRLKSFLQELPGVEIVGETNAYENILELVSAKKPEIVILNFHTPNNSGFPILTQLKKNTPQPIVMVMTNYSAQEYMTVCLQSGADYFFDKTYDQEKIIEIVKDHLSDSKGGSHD